MQKKLKRVGTDIAGYSLILLGLSLGWLPGPGGIPLILAGLGLLSIHNKWAKRILHALSKNGSKLMGYLFPNDKRAQALHDIFVIVVIGLVIFLVLNYNNYVVYGLCIALLAIATADFLYNRERLKRIRHH